MFYQKYFRHHFQRTEPSFLLPAKSWKSLSMAVWRHYFKAYASLLTITMPRFPILSFISLLHTHPKSYMLEAFYLSDLPCLGLFPFTYEVHGHGRTGCCFGDKLKYGLIYFLTICKLFSIFMANYFQITHHRWSQRTLHKTGTCCFSAYVASPIITYTKHG